jgi:predicted PurR-regulated permease PerM
LIGQIDQTPVAERAQVGASRPSDTLPALMSGSELTALAPRPPRRLQAPTPRVALVIAAAVVVGIVLYLGRSALTPFIVGALLIYILDPAVGFFARLSIRGRRMPRGLAVLVVYAITFVVIFQGLALLLGPLVAQMLEYVRNLPELLASIESFLDDLGETYRGLNLPPAIRDFFDGFLEDLGRGAGNIDFGSLLPVARTLLGTVAGFFGFVIIPIWAFYILRDRIRLRDQFAAALPPAWRTDAWAVVTIIERVVGRWIRGQILLGLIVGGATFGGLLLLGWLVDPRFHQFAILLAVVAGLLELLPIIGPIISMIPTLLVALTTGDPAIAIIGVLILYTAVQQLENAVLVPKIQGEAVELHPSVVIFALIVGAAIAGLPGAIFSIPVTAAARNVYRYLFRRLSEEDPFVPAPDAPDMRPLHEHEPLPEPVPAEGAGVAADRPVVAAPEVATEAAAAAGEATAVAPDRTDRGSI